MTIDDWEDWSDLIPLVTFLLNNRIFHNETLTPSQLQFGTSFLRHDFMRPEQETLFKNIIPKHFVETENKYKDILDDEINKFNDRRLRNLRLRQDELIKIKSRLSLKLMILWLLKHMETS